MSRIGYKQSRRQLGKKKPCKHCQILFYPRGLSTHEHRCKDRPRAVPKATDSPRPTYPLTVYRYTTFAGDLPVEHAFVVTAEGQVEVKIVDLTTL